MSSKSPRFGQTALLMSCDRRASPGEQMAQVMEALSRALPCDRHDVCFVHLYISDVSHFAAINETYCKYFGTNPPSRSCVATSLPDGIIVAADALYCPGSYTSTEGSIPRRVLHVRSMSEWAPLCIGPYSQANLLEERLALVAGQIALDPARMTIFPSMGIHTASGCIEVTTQDLAMQLALCVRNALRTLEALRSVGASGAFECVPAEEMLLSCTVYINVPLVSKFMTNTGIGWRALKSLIHRLLAQHFDDYALERKSRRSQEDYEDEDEEEVNEEGVQRPSKDGKDPVPVLLVGVSGIPKDSLAEVEFIGCPYRGRLMAGMGAANLRCLDGGTWAGFVSLSEGVLTLSGDQCHEHLGKLVLDHVRIAIRAALSGCAVESELELCVVRAYYRAADERGRRSVSAASALAVDTLRNWTLVGVPVVDLEEGVAIALHVSLYVKN